jgi:hypothetical protein
MKHLSMSLLLAVLLLMLVVPASAQISLSSQATFSGKSYTTSQLDTSASYRLAGAGLLSVVTFTADTAAWDLYVDYSLDRSTWTTILTDSVKSTNTTAKVTEHSIRDTDSDAIDGLYGWIRVRNAQRASGTAVVGTYTQKLYYRP